MPPVPHQAEFDALKAQVDQLSADVSVLKTQMAQTAKQADLAALAHQVQLLTVEINTINNRLDALENPPSTPVDCVLSEWSEWSAWTPNGDGTETRTRTRTIVTQPQHGGAECGPLNETETRYIPVHCVMGEEEIVSVTPVEACRPEGLQTVRVDWERPILTPPQYGGDPCGPTIGYRYEEHSCVYVPIPPGGDTHAYFNELRARSDCKAAFGLRDAEEVARYAPHNSPKLQVYYDYLNDPDPRKLDAMTIRIDEGDVGVYGTFTAPIGPSNGANLFFTADVWFGNEYRQDYSKLHLFKETPFSIQAASTTWVALRASFKLAVEDLPTQPPGGPYVFMTVPQPFAKSGICKTPDTWMSGQVGYPPMEFGTRRYNEAISPMENEFGVVGDRLTRFALFFERRPSEDWVSDHPNYLGRTMMAYAYSLWGSDTERDPVRILNERILGMPSEWVKHFSHARFTYQDGNAAAADMWPGRGPITSYQRNWVVLHGTSKQDVVTNLLKKPIA